MVVYAVHPVTDIDLSKALIFGEIKYINHRYVFVDELGDRNTIPKENWDRLVDAAENFDPGEDYLLIAGDHLQLVAMSALLANYCTEYRVLRYDRHAGGYVPVTLILENEESDED